MSEAVLELAATAADVAKVKAKGILCIKELHDDQATVTSSNTVSFNPPASRHWNAVHFNHSCMQPKLPIGPNSIKPLKHKN